MQLLMAVHVYCMKEIILFGKFGMCDISKCGIIKEINTYHNMNLILIGNAQNAPIVSKYYISAIIFC